MIVETLGEQEKSSKETISQEDGKDKLFGPGVANVVRSSLAQQREKRELDELDVFYTLLLGREGTNLHPLPQTEDCLLRKRLSPARSTVRDNGNVHRPTGAIRHCHPRRQCFPPKKARQGVRI